MLQRFLYPFVFLFALVPVLAPAQAPVQPVPKADPERATFRIRASSGGGSATCVWVEGGKSVLISNNHVFSDLGPDGKYVLAPYPLGVLVSEVESKKEVAVGEAVGGDETADITVIVVAKPLPFTPMAKKNAAAGTKVWHRGATSVFTGGLVVEPPGVYVEKYGQFASNLSSIPGDSGAGIVNAAGEVVGINCGRFSVEATSPQRGTPISHIRVAVKKVVGVKAFPRLAEELKSD